MKEVEFGLLGLGTVGAGVVDGLARNGRRIEERTGIRLRLRAAADPDPGSYRGGSLGGARRTADSESVVDDPRCSVLVEAIGGTGEARRLVLRALALGKPVVTANKALLAEHGAELFKAARRNETAVFFEASVCGGIPLIRAIREGLAANELDSLVGILNGTCNHILTRMEEAGMSFEEALAEAQAGGYAEADPSLDIDGHDAAHKACILASLAYGRAVRPSQLRYRGIRGLDRFDLLCASELGYRIKPLASIRRARNRAEVIVRPALVPMDHVLAGVSGVYNAVLVDGDLSGRTLYYGRGAGRDPTAGAVLGDLADAAGRRLAGGPWNNAGFTDGEGRVPLQDPGAVRARRYMRMTLCDRPGVLATVARAMGNHRISLASVLQHEVKTRGQVPVILLTRPAPGRAVRAALREIERLEGVIPPVVCYHLADVGPERALPPRMLCPAVANWGAAGG